MIGVGLMSKELIGVCDDEGVEIGSATEEDIYERMLPHKIVEIMLRNPEGKFYMHIRSKKKVFPESLTFTAGGHVKYKEDIEEAARRELREEQGINVELRKLGTFRYKAPGVPLKLITTFTGVYEGELFPDEREISENLEMTKEEIWEHISSGKSTHPELVAIMKKFYSETQS